MITATEIDEYVVRFDREFFLYAGCIERESITKSDMEDQTEHSLIVGHSLSESTTPSTWYIDSGDSIHMIGARDILTEITKTILDLEVVWVRIEL